MVLIVYHTRQERFSSLCTHMRVYIQGMGELIHAVIASSTVGWTSPQTIAEGTSENDIVTPPTT